MAKWLRFWQKKLGGTLSLAYPASPVGPGLEASKGLALELMEEPHGNAAIIVCRRASPRREVIKLLQYIMPTYYHFSIVSASRPTLDHHARYMITAHDPKISAYRTYIEYSHTTAKKDIKALFSENVKVEHHTGADRQHQRAKVSHLQGPAEIGVWVAGPGGRTDCLQGHCKGGPRRGPRRAPEAHKPKFPPGHEIDMPSWPASWHDHGGIKI